MKRSVAGTLLAMVVSLVCGGAVAKQVVKTEEIERSFQFVDPGSRQNWLVIDNIDGGIRVRGDAGKTVRVRARERLTARNERKMQEARERVKLAVEEQDDNIVLRVEAPYRQRDGSANSPGWRRYGYEAVFDFEVLVPKATNLELATINNGEISVDSVAGDFEVNNVNGGVALQHMSGSGSAYALNGDITVVFLSSPQKDSYVGSLNGEVSVFCPVDLAAVVRFKTFNGAVYTDFDFARMASSPAPPQRENGKFVWRSDRSTVVRVGRGGPELFLDAFNGDIRLKKN